MSDNGTRDGKKERIKVQYPKILGRVEYLYL
jgi:hypothetical protein